MSRVGSPATGPLPGASRRSTAEAQSDLTFSEGCNLVPRVRASLGSSVEREREEPLHACGAEWRWPIEWSGNESSWSIPSGPQPRKSIDQSLLWYQFLNAPWQHWGLQWLTVFHECHAWQLSMGLRKYEPSLNRRFPTVARGRVAHQVGFYSPVSILSAWAGVDIPSHPHYLLDVVLGQSEENRPL